MNYFLHNSTVLLDETELNGVKAGDIVKVDYATEVTFPQWHQTVTGDTKSLELTVVEQPYKYCHDVITMNLEEIELEPGRNIEIDLSSIQATEDCQFSIKYEIAKATPDGTPLPLINLVQPVFSLKAAPSGL